MLARLARLDVVRGLSWWAAFVLVQIRTVHLNACADFPPHSLVRTPFGERHIHWCIRKEALPGHEHGVHRCHGCQLVWYDREVSPLDYRLHHAEYQAMKLMQSLRDDTGYGFVVDLEP